jgi:hypothetical protein
LSNAVRKAETRWDNKHVFVDVDETCPCRDCDVETYMRVKRLKWAGHVIRMFDNRFPNRILEGNVGERRPTGRTRTLWEDGVRKDGKVLKTKNLLSAVAR